MVAILPLRGGRKPVDSIIRESSINLFQALPFRLRHRQEAY